MSKHRVNRIDLISVFEREMVPPAKISGHLDAV